MWPGQVIIIKVLHTQADYTCPHIWNILSFIRILKTLSRTDLWTTESDIFGLMKYLSHTSQFSIWNVVKSNVFERFYCLLLLLFYIGAYNFIYMFIFYDQLLIWYMYSSYYICQKLFKLCSPNYISNINLPFMRLVNMIRMLWDKIISKQICKYVSITPRHRSISIQTGWTNIVKEITGQRNSPSNEDLIPLIYSL